jgi:ADP-heptose:LPS heptosyltransferase
MSRFDRILVIRSGAIGDFIVTLPVIHLLRQTYAKSWLVVMAKNRFRGLVKDVVDEFIDIDGRLLMPLFHETVDRSCEEYRYLNEFDLIVSYLGVRGQVKKNLDSLGGTRVINGDPLPPDGYKGHITEFLLEPVSEIVDVSSAPLPSVAIRQEERARARTFLSASRIESAGTVIAVHPGSGGRPKVAPAELFCEAVNWIWGRSAGATVLAVEGEADEQDVCAFEQGLKTPCVRLRKEDLLEVAAILSQASLFIGNDSGIAHLAAAVGVPSVVVFRASDPAVWAPKGKEVWVANEDSFLQTAEQAARRVLAIGEKLL